MAARCGSVDRGLIWFSPLPVSETGAMLTVALRVLASPSFRQRPRGHGIVPVQRAGRAEPGVPRRVPEMLELFQPKLYGAVGLDTYLGATWQGP